jgi:hypothetical protein
MKKSNKPTLLKVIGGLWIVLGPIGVLQALISTVESDTTYRIQLWIFSVTGTLSVISGIGLLFLRRWAQKILRMISWLTFIYYAGSGVLITVLPLVTRPDHSASTVLIFLFVGLAVVATGIPFLLMALYLGSNKVNYFLKPQNKPETPNNH